MPVDESWFYGWAGTHDYDPRWDYEVLEDQRNHELIVLAQQTVDTITQQGNMPWDQGRVYPADLADQDAVALWAYGTEAAPVIMLDLQKHVEVGPRVREAVVDSVVHELRHAYQEANGWELCEQEAEHGSARIPF